MRVVTGLPPSAAGVRGVWAVPCGCCSDPPSGTGAGAPRPHAWRRQCGLGGASPRASAAPSPQPPSWAALCPPLARTHTWPRLAGRAGQDPQERPGQKPAVRASAEWGRPGGHSTWGRGVGRVRSRHPVEAICSWAWPAVPAQGTQVPPRPCPELQQGRVWPRGGCLPVTMAPASPTTSPKSGPC